MNEYEEEAASKELEKMENLNTNKNELPKNDLKVSSLGKAMGYQGNDSDEPAILPGYVEIWSENFPTQGIFYAKDTRFFIRSAEVKEIRQFSMINEQDPFSIDEALNEIVKSCLMMRTPGKQILFKDLKEEDRIFIIMEIRALTFSKGENQLVLKPICRDCNHENEIKIDNDSLERTELTDQILKYYDEESRTFHVRTKSSGVIKIVPPSIGVMMEVTKYIRKQQEEGKKIDQSFIKVLPYMIQEWRGLNENLIKNLEMESMSWNKVKYQTMFSLVDLCRVGVKEELRRECEKCGTEVTVPISFPGGIKSLFIISDISGELL